ncbi:LysR family transcriptional regulator [Actinokineospora sp. HUAS TT18]|uniref:LysR family transcriptional regulator n=1 Tax=Actinokineospora sp. HUAS TT18 TaxID=3447451 RepID=UPI003F5204AA
MDVTWLATFRAVARTGSFTAAAKDLRYTQSAVSRQVSALEDTIGAALFDRLPRGVLLTEQGRTLLAHAEAVLDRLDLARRDAIALRETSAGRVRIGAFASADAALVPRSIAEFHRECPGVEVSLTEGRTPGLVEQVRTGRVDVAVVSLRAGAEVDGVRLRHLVDEPMLVALPRDHRFARRRTVRLAELSGERWIAGSANPEDTLLAGTPESVHYVVREWVAKMGFVAAGLGVTLIPALAASGTRPDVLVKRLHPDDAPVRGVHAATAAGVADSAAVTAFLPILRGTARDLRAEW